MVVFPNSGLNNFKAWNIEVSDEESNMISSKAENILIPVLWAEVSNFILFSWREKGILFSW